jgi:group II intron reverse transcriptase/maturase
VSGFEKTHRLIPNLAGDVRSRKDAVSPLLGQIASEDNLWTAWDEICLKRGAPGVDGVTVRMFARSATEAISRLAGELTDRTYRPRPLRRVWVPKRGKEEEYRPLVVPTVRDRVAARAAAQVLEHVFEPLFHHSSIGYRPGRSTLTALRRVTRLRDAGASWVARADVNDFFDRIDQHALFRRLEPVLPAEVRRLLVLWTRTWIHDGEERVRALSGVPQGAPTSPVLSNFYLTPFDEHLEFEGVDAVRYADDLIALARTSKAASTALTIMASALDLLGLELNRRTSVASFNDGFEFLGFGLRGKTIRIAESKLNEFRRHALFVLEHPRAGSMRRRIALLNRMVRGWRAYYRAGIPRDQFDELDGWLEQQVRTATLRRWAEQRPNPRDLELAGLESLHSSARRIFHPPNPPSLEGYEYRIPVEGHETDTEVIVAEPGQRLHFDNAGAVLTMPGRPAKRIRPGTRTVVFTDGTECESRALRALLDRGISLRFVSNVATRVSSGSY